MPSVSYDYDGTTVIVTGGGSGIGRAIARRFGEAGATLVVADLEEQPRDPDEETPTHEVVEDAGGTAAFVRTDVSDPTDLEAVVAAAREYGGVDVMVNNAGINRKMPFLEVTPDDYDRINAVNARGVFFGTQAAALDMLDRADPGVVVNTVSISGWLALPGMAPYEASKGAARMITRGTAYQLAPHGIRVCGIAPGQIATEISPGRSRDVVRDVEEDALFKPVPLGRAGYPADLAGVVLFLASDDAAYITGEIVTVDGGWRLI